MTARKTPPTKKLPRTQAERKVMLDAAARRRREEELIARATRAESSAKSHRDRSLRLENDITKIRFQQLRAERQEAYEFLDSFAEGKTDTPVDAFINHVVREMVHSVARDIMRDPQTTTEMGYMIRTAAEMLSEHLPDYMHYRREGFGKALVAELMETAHEAGIELRLRLQSMELRAAPPVKTIVDGRW